MTHKNLEQLIGQKKARKTPLQYTIKKNSSYHIQKTYEGNGKWKETIYKK